MPYPLRMLSDAERVRWHVGPYSESFTPGSCYFAPWLLTARWSNTLGMHYRRKWASVREPILIWLPNEAGSWSPDQMACDGERGWHGDGWTVVGDLPDITVTPSINIAGRYHGYLTRGVLSDDMDIRPQKD